MKIIRYSDPQGAIHFASEQEDGSRFLIQGDLYGEFKVTGEFADVAKILAPVVPSVILCAGLNYRQHAAETGAKVPAYPVLFMKLPGSIQNPGDPIV